MARLLQWGQVGKKTYETGVDRGVLYTPDNSGVYVSGVAWNGLTTVTQTPSGAESNKQYADNGVYLNLQSAEEFGGTIEALTYPDEFGQHDGTAEAALGVILGQQGRKSFGLAYRTLKGNDVVGNSYGYKLHLVYSALASPSEKAHATVNDSPEPVTFSWEFSTTPVPVGVVNGKDYKPTSIVTIDSTKVAKVDLDELEVILYGTEAVADDPATTTVNEAKAAIAPRLPTPAEVLALFPALA